MKRITTRLYIVLIFSSILISNCFAQSIYKGLEYGMSKSEANKEFKKNKEAYTTVDLGNGFLYRIYKQNFEYDNNRLVGILLTPKGAAFGQTYESSKNYLIHTRGFFEKLGYETFLENEWWNAPVNYVKSGSKWGLILNKKDKSTIVQMYPISYELSGSTVYLVKLMIWNYDTWIGYYNKEKEVQNKKAKDSGF
ncbi:MAG: hypothetical protein JEY97_08175 [Bacteroidales bacterium]|nr:hypothetical protein [Bacteroidales bacterium]